MQFVVRLFPEIMVKSKPVRRRFVQILRNNLQRLLRAVDPAVRVVQGWDRIDIYSDLSGPEPEQLVAAILRNTPGISKFHQVREYPLGDFDDVASKVRVLYEPWIKGKTFAVRCKRLGDHSFISRDIERHVGSVLFMNCHNGGVDLTNPEVTVRFEIVHDKLFVIDYSCVGLGGFPLGTQEAVVSLISGGFDSAVASYLTMKRGMLTHFCFFNLGGREHEIGVKEVALYLWLKYGASHRVRFVTIPFEDVVREILEKVDNAYMGVILKRMMLRAATVVARELQSPALVTGEAVAQVSSQTLLNLSVINSVTDMLVLRPLITMDKFDIIDIARKIGTEGFSASMPEYCGVISVKPTTRAKPERVLREEEEFDFTVLDKAIQQRRTINIDEIANTGPDSEVIAVVQEVPAGAVVIDIRHPDEEEKKPLANMAVPVVKIPFYQLHKRHAELDRQQYYLLYCEKGIMSRLQAQFLREEGFANTAVLV